MRLEKQKILDDIEKYKKAIEILKENGVSSFIYKYYYSEIIKSELNLYNLEMNGIKNVVKEVLEENLNDLEKGNYQYKIILTKDMQGNLFVETSVDDTSIPSEWTLKKDFALEKFNSIGIPFEKVKEDRFDIWSLNGYDFNVHFTHLASGWYGISSNAINNGYDFILIDSNFLFCILSNSFINKLYKNGLLTPTTGEKSNRFQQNLYIDWLNRKVYDYDVDNEIGVVGIEEYKNLFEKYL